MRYGFLGQILNQDSYFDKTNKKSDNYCNQFMD